MPRDVQQVSCSQESRQPLNLRSGERGPSTRYRALLNNHLLLQRELHDQQVR